MAYREIKTYPDPVLRKVCAPVNEITDDVVKLCNDMVETMHLAQGAGLAANQVGVSLRLFVVERETKKKDKPIILLNPVIVEQDSEEISEEGCLSLPKFYEFVKRAQKVLVRAIDLKGQPFEMECEGFLAKAIQHELDHLNGILFIDHLSPIKRDLFKKKYMKDRR
ncbi:peptide deformylase [Syntrophorhabdus aromaticivorans]|uniref:Peptide deformylase n=1 Tax=Syntrophorhabdus aromaticivorans TaxID=328301 RepID=A0A351TZM0_9BACT|nr:peptide deformylase [Syntrophorhabdus aromaticivorans]NLW35460.1 peptide deformylase [Syntrophorhabdus aromaticivorans]HBA53151.1 peptide deformylase [Syntrophorhabdus aromaticivorans]